MNLGEHAGLVTINEPEKLVEFINGCLKPKEKEKKENGEVFTPLFLVNEMLDKLDEAYGQTSIFAEPAFKWFDPAVGIGNFVIVLYQRLMAGLAGVIPDEEERRTHILEDMIYAAELNPKNVETYKSIFCGDKYKLNIYEGDTLKMGMNKFDVILGNPPFQEKVGDRKTQAIWNCFVEHSLMILAPGGHLVFVHPSGWRSPEGVFKNILTLLQSKTLKFLCMNNFKKGRKVFKVGTNFDYYVLQNENSSNNMTKMVDMNGKACEKNMNDWRFIPSGGFELYEKLLAKEGEERVNVLYDRTLYGTDKLNMSNKQTGKFIWPCAYTVTKQNGLNFWYSSIKHSNPKNMFVPKVVLSNGLGTYPFIDLYGEYGLTQFSYAIVDDVENLKNIANALNDPKFVELMEYVKFQNNKYNHRVISLLKKDFWKEFLEPK